MCFSVQVDIDLKKLSQLYKAKVNKNAFEHFYNSSKKDSKNYKYVGDDGRIFTKIWAPIIIHHKGQREIRPMRYQLLPHFCESNKYTRLNPKTNRQVEIKNTYNARMESLLTGRAWQKPFTNYHGILPTLSFYEWVETQGNKHILEFTPKTKEHMNIACLYDNWFGKDDEIIQSFAIVTRNPEPEVLEAGHDRTPVNLSHEQLDKWLITKNKSAHEYLELLDNPHRPFYLSKSAS